MFLDPQAPWINLGGRLFDLGMQQWRKQLTHYEHGAAMASTF